MRYETAKYLQDVALGFFLGPATIPYLLARESPSLKEGDATGLAYPAAVSAGTLGASYTTLKMLNFIQGPKYAIPYGELRGGMSHGRYSVASRLAHPIVALPVAMAGMTAARPDLTKHTYQTAMTGQPSIGSAGHGLVTGSFKF